MSGPLIAEGECPFCGAVIEYREDKNGRLYFACNGMADTQSCGSRAFLGAHVSKYIRAKAEQQGQDHEDTKRKAVGENKQRKNEERSSGGFGFFE